MGLNYTAQIYFNFGQYYFAKDYYSLSKTIAEEQNNSEYIIKNTIGIAESCKLIGSTKSLNEGINILSRTILYAESIKSDSSSGFVINKTYFHNMYNELGNLYIDRLDYNFEKGKANLEKALKIAKELNDVTLLNKTYNNLGVLYLKEESKAAQLYFEKALLYDANPFMTSLIHRNLSILHTKFENYPEALNHIQISIKSIVPLDASNSKNLPSKLDLVNSNVKFQLISSLIDKANIWIKLSDNNPNKNEFLEEAIRTLDLADYLAEQTWINNSEQRSKLFWRKTASEIYLTATKACYLLNNVQKAFYFMEKNKALLLLEDLSTKISKNNSKIPVEINQQEQELKNKINKLKKLSTTRKTDSVQAQLLIAKDRYNNFINTLSIGYKSYFKTLQSPEVIDLFALKQHIPTKNTAYIEYILDDKEGYGLLITDTKTIFFEIKNCKELKNYTTQYRRLLETPFQDKEVISLYKSVSNKIYKSLFPDEIKADIGGKKLTIIPDYYLQNIPFESLLTSEKDNSYLLFQNEINYSYSLSFLIKNNEVERKNTNDVIAFAPVEFSSDLITLHNTEEELNLINDMFSAQLFLKDNATSENFFKESDNFKIIHIASHASANDSISPWISFYNDKIELAQIYNFKSSPDLVVLSACNTSLGKLYIGEGVMSLSRAFFSTGTHSVLPTLWEVNDKATLQILNSFYKNIKQGQNKSLSLHNAKLKYIKNNSLSAVSPYYWASFIMIGDTGVIKIESEFSTIYYIVIAFFTLIITIFYFKRKKSD
ncbi:CHAT domain-containing protein [Winogradskyella sp. PC D3.3]